ncbi:MAG TPA: hypothetical protein VG755_11770 [Nannocystaceae bacterium]|nr:hypothetical protein [Nannocystaceae bacterium]
MRVRASSFAFASLLIGCGVERIGDGGDAACVPPAVQMVFDARCNTGTTCHASGSANGSFAAGESAAIIGAPSQQSTLPLVVLGSIEGSYLAHKIMAVPPTPIVMTRMPMGANFDDPALAEDLALVLGWIGGATLPGCAGGESTSSGGNEPGACGLEDLDPGAANPIVAGDGAMQIPTDIGKILVDNCGCHYSPGPLARDAVPYPASGPFQISTWEQWQGDVSMTLTVIQDTLNRVDKGGENLMMFPGIIMPQPTYCHTGDGETMPLADRETLVAWLMAGAPDGATWTPP